MIITIWEMFPVEVRVEYGPRCMGVLQAVVAFCVCVSESVFRCYVPGCDSFPFLPLDTGGIVMTVLRGWVL